jgi:hypothetical protein
MPFDPRTVAFCATFAAVFQAAAMFYVWRTQLRERAVLELAISFSLIAVGASLGIARPHLPPALTHLAASTILIAGHAVGARAFGRFLGRPVPTLLLVGLVVAAGAVIAFFLFAAPRTDIRIATYSLAVAVSSLLIAGLLLDVPRGPLRTTHWPLGLLHLLHAGFALLRAFSVLIESSREDIFEPSVIQSLWFLQSLTILVLTFTFVVLIVSQRIALGHGVARTDGA